MVLRDTRIREASFSVVRPGDKVRITGIRDVVEPRVKVSGNGQVFPGILAPVESVGDGRTNRLSGMAVGAPGRYHRTIPGGLGEDRRGAPDTVGNGGAT